MSTERYVSRMIDLSILNHPRKMIRITEDHGACPLCGHYHYWKTKSDRCNYCGQRLLTNKQEYIGE